jgi:capsular polysaccharide biosynthesis protein
VLQRTGNDQRQALLPPEQIEIPPPVAFPPTPGLDADSHELPATALLTLPGACVNHEGLVFRRWPLGVSFARPWDGERFQHLVPRLRFLVKNFLLRLPRRPGRVLWITDNLSPDNWYHWLTEVLPRMFVAGPNLSAVDWIALPGYYRRSRFVVESLRLWPDLPPLLWIPWTQRVKGDPVLVVERVAPPYLYRPDVMCRLAEHLVEQAGRNRGDQVSGERLYVTRSDAARRRIANEREVRELLQDHGFSTMACSELSIPEQIRHFARATHVVGAHGAGLANVMFCRPGARVLEIATPDPHEHWRCYRNLAWSVGHEYGVLFASSAAPSGAGYAERLHADLRVDLATLRSALEWL